MAESKEVLYADADEPLGFIERLIACHPRYRDTVRLCPAHGEFLAVHLLKLAQLTAIALTSALGSVHPSVRFRDLHQLTVCSDYQVPKALCAGGLIRYDTRVARLMDERRLLAPGSREEVEIRGASVIASQWIGEYLQDRGVRCTTLTLDEALWSVGRSVPDPHHLCRTRM